MSFSQLQTLREGNKVTIVGKVSNAALFQIAFTSVAGQVPSFNGATTTADGVGNFTKHVDTVHLKEHGTITITATDAGTGSDSTTITLPVTVGNITLGTINAASFHTTTPARRVDVTANIYTVDGATQTAVKGNPDYVQFKLSGLSSDQYVENYFPDGGGALSATLTFPLGPDQFWAPPNGALLEVFFLDEDGNALAAATANIAPGLPTFSAISADADTIHAGTHPGYDLLVSGTVASSYSPKDSIVVSIAGKIMHAPFPSAGKPQSYLFIPWNSCLASPDVTGAFSKVRGDTELATLAPYRVTGQDCAGMIWAYTEDCWGNRCLTRAIVIGDAADLNAAIGDLAGRLELVGQLGTIVGPMMPGMRPPRATRPPAVTRPTPNPLPGQGMNGQAPDGGPLTGWESRGGAPLGPTFDPWTTGPDVDLGGAWGPVGTVNGGFGVQMPGSQQYPLNPRPNPPSGPTLIGPGGPQK